MNKTISIHQPQYLPWFPYFSKIFSSDCFVILDNVAFQKNGLQNRNQIKTAQGKSWLTIPVIHSFDQSIKDTKIANKLILHKHLKTIEINYRKSRYFDEVWALIFPILSCEYDYLSELNIALVQSILLFLNYNGITCLASSMNVSGKKSELIRNICVETGATQYISGIGGKAYLDLDDFSTHNINVIFQNNCLPQYAQLYPSQPFLNDLSIIDMLFNIGKSARNYLLEARNE